MRDKAFNMLGDNECGECGNILDENNNCSWCGHHRNFGEMEDKANVKRR